MKYVKFYWILKISKT